MPENIFTPDPIKWKTFGKAPHAGGVSLQKLEPFNCEAIFVRYAPGTFMPRHQHTAKTLTVILKGHLLVNGSTIGPGSILECDGPYGPRTVDEEVLMLVLQPCGTQYVPMDESEG